MRKIKSILLKHLLNLSSIFLSIILLCETALPQSSEKKGSIDAAAPANPVIAIFDIDIGEGVNPALRVPVSDSLRQAVADSGYFDIIERSRLDRIIDELDFQRSGYTDTDKALAASKGLNAAFMLLGNVGYIQPSYTLSLRLIDVESGKNLESVSRSVRGSPENLIDIAKELSNELLKKWRPAKETVKFDSAKGKVSPIESEQVLISGGITMRGGVPIKVGPFYMDKTEVTNAQYARFLQAFRSSNERSFCHPAQPPEKDHTPDHWNDPLFNHPQQPVVGIDWYDAYAYATWAGKRLPTEEEWELAATRGDGRTYPWGNIWDARISNNNESGHKRTMKVGSNVSGASPYGVLDMAGNAAEWCDGSSGPILRGGSFADDRNGVRCTGRMKMDALTRNAAFGFRCISHAESGDSNEYIEIVE